MNCLMNWCIFRVKVLKKKVFTPSYNGLFCFYWKTLISKSFSSFLPALNNFYHTNVVVGVAITVPSMVPSLSWTSPAG